MDRVDPVTCERFPNDKDVQYSRIFAGAMWPAQRPGFIVVIGERRAEHVLGQPELRLLDEAREQDLYRLVRRLAALRDFYNPERILVDGSNAAAMQFVADLPDRGARPEHSFLVEMQGPMSYAMPILKREIDVKRLVIPPTALLKGELLTIPVHEDPASLRLADYPAIAALAFAALTLQQSREMGRASFPTSLVCGDPRR